MTPGRTDERPVTAGPDGPSVSTGETTSRPRALWVAAGVYTVLTLVPLFVILAGPQNPERGFWIEFGVALGFIGLAMLCLQSILTARYPKLSASIGQDTMLQFHRQAGIVAFGFVLAHPVVLILADSGYWSFLDPRENFLRALFLVSVLIALPLLIVTSLWRETFRLPYQWWRLGHGALAAFILVVGLFHISRVHYYLSDPWKQSLWIAMGTASIASILYVRAIKPLRVKRHPYRVVSVEPAAARTWTLTLEPVAGPRLRFRAGQFAFLTLADSPFSLEQHPFSVASSARRTNHLQFAIKELGDFTGTIGELPTGQRAFVDGPYGSLRLPTGAAGLLLIAGGIGIAPIMSMLRTLRDDHADLPVVVLYAARRVEDLAYRDELDEIAAALRATIVPIVDDPPPGWDGEQGPLAADLLVRHLPGGVADGWHAVVCGPPALMEQAETTLVDAGVPLSRIHSERFDIGAAGAVGRRSLQVRRLVLALSAVMLAAAAAFAS
jgi:predicted ferric reductase